MLLVYSGQFQLVLYVFELANVQEFDEESLHSSFNSSLHGPVHTVSLFEGYIVAVYFLFGCVLFTLTHYVIMIEDDSLSVVRDKNKWYDAVGKNYIRQTDAVIKQGAAEVQKRDHFEKHSPDLVEEQEKV